MGKRFDTLVFPGGKGKACTFSYDDGVVQDRRLAELHAQVWNEMYIQFELSLLGQHAEGAAPGKRTVDISKVSPEELETVYAGHEIAGPWRFILR